MNAPSQPQPAGGDTTARGPLIWQRWAGWLRRQRQVAVWNIPAFIMVYVSMVCFRLELVEQLELDAGRAVELGLPRGLAYDGLASLIPFALGAWLCTLGLHRRLGFGLGAGFVWLATLAHVLHFKFFGMPLDWWIVASHWRDATDTGDAALNMSVSLRIVLSLACLVVAVGLQQLRYTWERKAGWRGLAAFGRRRLQAAQGALALTGLVLVLWYLPHLSEQRARNYTGSVLSSHIIAIWLSQNLIPGAMAGMGLDWASELEAGLEEGDLKQPSRVLAWLRDYDWSKGGVPAQVLAEQGLEATSDPANATSTPPEKARPVQTVGALAAGVSNADPNRKVVVRSADASTPGPTTVLPDPASDQGSPAPEATPANLSAEFPLVRTFQVDPALVASRRKQFGFPETGPLNVIYLFIESGRAYEFYRPNLGPVIWPETRALFDAHALQFPQSYSSSLMAGPTVRGVFSTLCSMYPNLLGAATYIAHPTTRLECIQNFLQNQGYATYWFNAYKSSFHNQETFERLHGTQEMFDGRFFRGLGLTHTIGSWGVADHLFLEASLRKLESLSQQGKPFFAQLRTVSTHPPFTEIPEGPLPADLGKLLPGLSRRPEYRAYLSRLRYADKAVSQFIRAFLQSPLSERTLLVILGDHSSPVSPVEPGGGPTWFEWKYRIPIAFISRGVTPERIAWPIHQSDVTPTVATVLGLTGQVTWIGRDGLAGPGTPQLAYLGDSLFYRVGNRACYTVRKRLQCYSLGARDPLIDAPIRGIEEQPAQTTFFHRVALANRRSIVLNRIMPEIK